MSSRNVGKYEFLIDEDVLTEEGLLEKANTIKRFEYLPLCIELKRQTDIVSKQYRELNKFSKFHKKEGVETINKEERDDDGKTQQYHNSNHSFYKYHNIKNIYNLSFKSRH